MTSRWGGRRYLPYAFTEHGVAMISNVLNSGRAIEVSIQIVKAFIKLRYLALEHKEIWKKIDEMEKKYDDSFKVVFDTLKSILLAGPGKLLRIKGFSKITKRVKGNPSENISCIECKNIFLICYNTYHGGTS